MFYYFDSKPEWRNPLDQAGLPQIAENLSHDLVRIHRYCSSFPFEFQLSTAQEQRHCSTFTNWTEEYKRMGDEEFSSIKRLGLIVFRIAMILTAVKRVDEDSKAENEECSDTDFDNAIKIAAALREHSKTLLDLLPEVVEIPTHMRLFEQLPESFTTSMAYGIGWNLELKPRTVRKYLKRLRTKGLLVLIKKGHYERSNAKRAT